MVRPAGVPASAWPADAYAFGRKDSKKREANEGHVRQTTTDIHQSAKLLAPRLSCFHAMRAWRPATTALKRFINLRLKNTSMRVPPVGPPHAAKKVLSKIDTMSMISVAAGTFLIARSSAMFSLALGVYSLLSRTNRVAQ